MICIDCLHMNLNRMLLLAVGLWPYQQSKLVQFQLILFFTILITCIIFQFTTFATSKCTSSLLINVFSSALFYIYFLILYSWFHINMEVVKCSLEQLQNMYNELTDKNEITIIKKYGNYGKRYTAGLILTVVFFAPSLGLYLHWPYLVNRLLPINDFRSRSSLFVTEYFIDQEKYSYLILFHTLTALFIGIITIIATGTLFIVYAHYGCGMFRITNYRIEQVMAIDTLQKKSILRNKNLIYKKLIRAVDMHREAMRFSESFVSKFKVMFSCLIAIAVASASLNLFRISQALSFGNNVDELLFPLITVGIYIAYILIANIMTQKIMDYNNNVFDTAYNIQWYAVSLNVQKMILFLLQRGTKVFSLNIAGLFVGSLEGAAKLLSTMMSFFTVLYSTRV
ncbi:uncharacterized protein LOC109610615 isoform X2 [Camponotus floridanus]|uniref:uncharacterized protein LOC109610615 isoform X2 n=1 Tax=Camponotus floridanus TaxID=104421 RepID=UPI000DC6A583|nr:uncharacterized protein LOC109610615 isoform X2 [Camponotus floridanus]